MSPSNTALVKYINLDVVGFTYKRPVEAQTEIITKLNDIVKLSTFARVSEDEVIYIPIGDGICICLICPPDNYDIHIQIAEDIIRRIVSLHNPSAKSNRKFEVRIGINENIDNIITDINGRKNVCGFGVNNSQRIMSFADSSQILVGRTTYDSLIPREKYSESFRAYNAETKHKATIELYQYIGGNVAGLNRNPPSFFAPPTEIRLTRYAAYYIAHVIKNKQFIDSQLDNKEWNLYPLGILMAYLAEDSVGRALSTRFRPYENHIPDTPSNTLQEQFECLDQSPYWSNVDLYYSKVRDKIQASYPYCFEASAPALFVSEKGKNKLQSEWPEIYEEFSLP
jgi:class 3 adenylate cyclase